MSPKFIKIVSWNVNGISNKVKRYKIITHLKSLCCDIAMLQETHLNETESLKLKQKWVGQVFFAPGNGASKGTSILISKKLKFNVSDMTADKDGRYVIISGLLEHQKVTLVSIYAPNRGQVKFIANLAVILAQYKDSPILMGGDFNLVHDAMLDRSKCPLPADRVLSASFTELQKTLGVSDVWRCVNPLSREYTFYSKVHNSYSRIDYLLISNSIIQNTINSEIHSLLISDHAPTSITISLDLHLNKTKQWKFDNMYLRDDKFVSMLRDKIALFFETNINSVSSIQTVWEAFKATCRGWCISYGAAKFKEKAQKKKNLELELKRLEMQHMSSPNNITLKNAVLYARAELQSIIHEETSFALYKLKKKYFESGDKAGKMLAFKLKQTENNSSIPTILGPDGIIISDTKQINSAFQAFYSDLYKSECPYNLQVMNDFFKNVPLPQINEQQKNVLDAELQECEVQTAIKALAIGRAPGQDGYTIEFYRTFVDVLSPILTKLYKDIIETQTMPATMNNAVISVVLKQGRDHQQMGNYRPLSLLNNDYKIFAKALAGRLAEVIPSLIHLDQVGFIAGRNASQNMRRLFHVFSEAATFNNPAVAISLDAEKAFDRIEWSYLFNVLGKYGFGKTCLQWIKALYNNPTATVKTNGLISQPFTLSRSTRQGCPVSPSIFLLAIEPLACAIRANQNINGITVCQHMFKINLFADDILLTLTKPEQSIVHLLKLINDFGSFSGYKINWSKSETIPLNKHSHPAILATTPLVWKQQGMKYLGTVIKSPIGNIFEMNGPKLLQTIKDDLRRWTNLPLSLWGRAEVLKMNVLPRLIFLFSSIPMKYPQSWFSDINKQFSLFLWKEKRPRISLRKLSIPRKMGGLGVPDIYTYYLALNAQYPLSWAYKRHTEIGSWSWLEHKIVLNACRNTSLASFWYKPKYDKRIQNPLISFSCEIAKVIHKRLKINGSSLPSCPVWNNPLFTAGGQPLVNDKWKSKNIQSLGQLLHEGEMVPFQQLKTLFNLNNSDSFLYIQLKSIFSTLRLTDTHEYLDSQLQTAINGHKTVSKLYKLLNYDFFELCTSIMKQWEKDVDIQITKEEWKTILSQSNYISKCVRYKLIQLKILFRSYITPQKMHKMNCNLSDLCWHGCGMTGTFIHQLWQCPEVKTFWIKVKDLLCQIFNMNLQLCPTIAILGKNVEGVKSKTTQKLIALAFLTVKRMLLINWKVRKPNCFLLDKWVGEYLELVSMEQAASALDLSKEQSNIFDLVWSALKQTDIN